MSMMMPPGGAPPGGPPGGAPDLTSLLAALGGAGGAPGAGPPGGGGPPSGDDQLEALQQVIQDLHTLASVLTDPQATQVVMTCLAQLTKVQTTMMQSQQGSPQQAIGQRLSGPAY